MTDENIVTNVISSPYSAKSKIFFEFHVSSHKQQLSHNCFERLKYPCEANVVEPKSRLKQ